jgi:hypothetical protein
MAGFYFKYNKTFLSPELIAVNEKISTQPKVEEEF